MKLKTVLLGIIASAVMHSSMAAVFSQDLYITNNTNDYASAIINGSACTSIVGKIGEIKPHSTKKIKGAILSTLCNSAAGACNAQLYMSKSCGGDMISEITIDSRTGVTGFSAPKNDYVLGAAGYTLRIDKK